MYGGVHDRSNHGVSSGFVLIALNGIFVAGEFSLVAVDAERVEVMAGEGHRRA